MSAEAKTYQQDRPAYSIPEWCLEARVSPALYFKMQVTGRGPRTVHMGRRAIVIESPRAFYARLASESASVLEVV
jgi:hypothetical protein